MLHSRGSYCSFQKLDPRNGTRAPFSAWSRFLLPQAPNCYSPPGMSNTPPTFATYKSLMPRCRDTTWGKGQHPSLVEPKRWEEVPDPAALPDGQRTARKDHPFTCSVSVSAAKATRSRVPPRSRSRARRVSLRFSSSSQRLRLRNRRLGGGERLGAGSGFPRAASCTLRRR